MKAICAIAAVGLSLMGSVGSVSAQPYGGRGYGGDGYGGAHTSLRCETAPVAFGRYDIGLALADRGVTRLAIGTEPRR